MSRLPEMRQRRVRRQSLGRIALVVGAIGLAVIVAIAVVRPDELMAGPVAAGGGQTGNSVPADVGGVYSFGYLLTTDGKQPAVLEQVRVLGVTGPIEVLGVMARPHPSGPKPYAFMLALGFPPPDYPSKPLAEEHVVPLPTALDAKGSLYGGLQLVVGVKSTGPGVGRIRGIEFTYRVGNRHFRNSSDGNGFLCAPASEYVEGGPKSKDCPADLESYAWDKKSVDFHVPASKQ